MNQRDDTAVQSAVTDEPEETTSAQAGADTDAATSAGSDAEVESIDEVADPPLDAPEAAQHGEDDEPDTATQTVADQTSSAQTPSAQTPSAQNPSALHTSAAAASAMTAADYARTTSSSADHTSVIPAITETVVDSSHDDQPAGRQARLRLTHVEPWSVTRLSFVISVALMIVAVVAVAIFWIVMDLTGVWDQLNGSVTNVLSDNSGNFDVTDYLGLGRLVGLTLLLSAINVVVMTALATIGAHLYNLAAQLLGGIEVTFGDH